MDNSTDPRREILRLFHSLPLEQRPDFWRRMGSVPVEAGITAIQALMAELADADEYRTEWVPIDSIRPSPENDALYGAVQHDEQMDALIESISRHLDDPLIVSQDGYIISGHRRYYACTQLHMDEIPIRRKSFSRQDMLDEWPAILAEYNCQRVKTAGMLLREALVRHAEDDPTALLADHRAAGVRVIATFEEVAGTKYSGEITEKKRPFLDAVKRAVNELKAFWPLTVRHVHYRLLNDAPLISRAFGCGRTGTYQSGNRPRNQFLIKARFRVFRDVETRTICAKTERPLVEDSSGRSRSS